MKVKLSGVALEILSIISIIQIPQRKLVICNHRSEVLPPARSSVSLSVRISIFTFMDVIMLHTYIPYNE
jgi:hypothetical protein